MKLAAFDRLHRNSTAGKIALSIFAAISCSMTANAAPTDIIADNSIIRDDLARLAQDGLIKTEPSSLLQDRILTRSDAAHLLEDGLGLLSGATLSDHGVVLERVMDGLGLRSGATPRLGGQEDVAAIRSAVIELRPELVTDRVDVNALLKGLPANDTSYDLALEAEARINNGGTHAPGSGTIGIYRGAVVGDLGSSTQYGLAVSNQAEDDRRIFFNDIGPHDYSALSQAYLQFNGWHGLNFLAGRTDDNWGAGAIGGSLISDNSPPLDQLRVSFPFSLGKSFGRHWNYTQLAATYDENQKRIYFQARRVEINFNSKWSGQYEEALKSTSSSMLVRAPLPFYPAKLIDNSTTNDTTEFIANFGLQYQPVKQLRTYGQFLLNDINNPFRVIGLQGGSNTPQRLAYIAGASYDSGSGTSITAEYSAANATTYLDSKPNLAWIKGAYDNLGFPSGPNSNEVDGLISQRLSPQITLYLDGRDRFRFNNSYPAPTVREVAASAKYQIDRRNSFSLTYHDYHQEAFPISPGAPGYPGGDGFIPVSESNPGVTSYIRELDAGYTLVF